MSATNKPAGRRASQPFFSSVTIKAKHSLTVLSNMLKVEVDYESRSRSSIASIFEDLVSLRKSFLRKDSNAAVTIFNTFLFVVKKCFPNLSTGSV